VPERPRYAFQHYGEQFGIGSATINTMAQDRNGFFMVRSPNRIDPLRRSERKVLMALRKACRGLIDQLLVAPDGALWLADRNKASQDLMGYGGIKCLSQDEAPIGVQMIAVDARDQVYVTTAECNSLRYDRSCWLAHSGDPLQLAMPLCRSSASICGRRPRNSTNESIAGRLPPTARIEAGSVRRSSRRAHGPDSSNAA